MCYLPTFPLTSGKVVKKDLVTTLLEYFLISSVYLIDRWAKMAFVSTHSVNWVLKSNLLFSQLYSSYGIKTKKGGTRINDGQEENYFHLTSASLIKIDGLKRPFWCVTTMLFLRHFIQCSYSEEFELNGSLISIKEPFRISSLNSWP